MAKWYTGSVQYTAIAVWTAGATLAVGAIRRQTAPTVAGQRAFRVSAITTGITGGSEPSWNLNQSVNTTDGGVTWTECTGQEAYGWSAAAPFLGLNLSVTRALSGDTFFVASNHNFASTTSITWGLGDNNSNTSVLCVNPAGSVPPVAADITTGAVESTTSSFFLEALAFIYGVEVKVTGAGTLRFDAANISKYINCVITNNSTSTLVSIIGGGNGGALIWENCRYNAAGSANGISVSGISFTWRNSPGAITGASPTNLFRTADFCTITLEGVDLSSFTGNLLQSNVSGTRTALVNCKLNASMTYPAFGGVDVQIDTIISAASGIGYTQERHHSHATLTTETTLVRATGSSDGVTAFSWKVVTASINCWTFPFVCFPISKWVTAGSPVTCTVAILNDGTTLTNSDIWMEVEVLDSSGSPLAAPYSCGIANPLVAASNLATDSGSVWTTTGLSSPVKQYMQVTFTPQISGYIRCWIYVGKRSQTLYIDPLLQT